MGLFENDRTFKERISWFTTFIMVVFHLCAVAALFMFNWKALGVAVFLWWVSGSLGIGMAYHRLLTHRGYKTYKWVEYFLTLCGTLALEGGPFFGLQSIVSTIKTPTRKVIRTHRMMAASGRTWGGSSPAVPCITTPRSSYLIYPIFAKTSFTPSSANGIGCPRSW